MIESNYVNLSAQIALERRMDTLADNVANANTPGFRATKIRFAESLDGRGMEETAFVRETGTQLDLKQGAFTETGNSLDFAIRGEGWFGVETDAGMALTRDGRFMMDAEGGLRTMTGEPVLDAGGAAIQLDPNGGDVSAGSDGFLYQNGQQAGAVGIFGFEPTGETKRYGPSGVLPEGPANPILDRFDVGVVQGFVEQSNVDPIREMTNLVKLQRTFDAVATLVKDVDSSNSSAVQFLSGR